MHYHAIEHVIWISIKLRLFYFKVLSCCCVVCAVRRVASCEDVLSSARSLRDVVVLVRLLA